MIRRLTIILAGIIALTFATTTHTQAQFAAKRRAGMVKIDAPVAAEVSAQPVAIVPTAVKKSANVIVNAETECWATLQIMNSFGQIVLEQQMAVNAGENTIPIFFISKLNKGVYTSVLKYEGKRYNASLVKE